MGFSLVAVSRGYSLVAVDKLLISVAPLVAELTQALGAWALVAAACGLSRGGSWALEHRHSRCGTQAYLPSGMWDLPRPGIEPMSPVLAGRFFTTEAPAKSSIALFNINVGDKL